MSKLTAKVITFLSLLCITVVAFAQDAGVVSVDGGTTPAVVSPTTNANGFMDQIMGALNTHRWDLAGVLGVIGLVSLLRWVGPKLHGALGVWLNSNRGGAVLALANGCAMSVATTLLAGGKLSPQIVTTGFALGVAAAGGWNVMWDIFAPADKKAGAEVQPLPPPISPAALLPFFLAVGLSLSVAGCACSLPKNANNPGCKVLDVVVSCLPNALGQGLAALVSAVTPAISGGVVDWGALTTLEKQYGTSAVMCAAQQALHIASGMSGVAQHPDLAMAAVNHLQASRDAVKKNVAELFAKRHVVIASAQ